MGLGYLQNEALIINSDHQLVTSTLRAICPEYSLKGRMLKLKLQYFGHFMWRTHLKRPWCWERLKAGGKGDDRGRDGWMASPTQWAWVWVNSGSWWWTGRAGMLQSMGSQRVRCNWVTKLNWMMGKWFNPCVAYSAHFKNENEHRALKISC